MFFVKELSQKFISNETNGHYILRGSGVGGEDAPPFKGQKM